MRVVSVECASRWRERQRGATPMVARIAKVGGFPTGTRTVTSSLEAHLVRWDARCVTTPRHAWRAAQRRRRYFDGLGSITVKSRAMRQAPSPSLRQKVMYLLRVVSGGEPWRRRTDMP